ncbi:efflux RND transporter periplasmic adaptor subunit [Rhodophyticola sp. CCM32]|nr:efflux RND transporter periplasmic adaptor subunit [Rhodophyticola sp. CCM32]
MYPQVNGYTIDAMYFDIGDTVSEGDVLARLNSQTLEAQVAQAEAELARAEAGVSQAESQIASARASLTEATSVLSRAEQLRSSGTGTQANLDQATASERTARATLASVTDGLAVAQAQQQQVQAQLDIAQLNLDHAAIMAPVDGLISARNGRLGAIAASGGEPIFRLIVGSRIEVEAEVLETAISGVGQDSDVTLDIAGLGPVQGQVRLISPTVDPVTRLGIVRISIPPTQALRAGLFASGWIITERRTSLSVPTTAVLSDADGAYVFVVADDRLSRREISPGLIWEGQREVLDGLAEDEVVVARAGAFFSDGDVVTPVFVDEQSEIAETGE